MSSGRFPAPRSLSGSPGRASPLVWLSFLLLALPACGSEQEDTTPAAPSADAGRGGSAGKDADGSAGVAGSPAHGGSLAASGHSAAGSGGQAASAGQGGSGPAGAGGSTGGQGGLAGQGGAGAAGSGGASGEAGAGGNAGASGEAGAAGSGGEIAGAGGAAGGISGAGGSAAGAAGNGEAGASGAQGGAGGGAGEGAGGASGGASGGAGAGGGGSASGGAGGVGVEEDPYGCGQDGVVAGNRLIHVDASAAEGGDGSLAAPFRSLQQAFSAVQNGENGVLCIAEGVYPEHVGSGQDVFSGGRTWALIGGFRAGQGYTQRNTVAFPTSLVAPDRSAAALTFGNARGITVDGLHISGGLHGIRVQGGYSAGRSLRVRNCRVFDNGVDGQPSHQGAGMYLSGSDILVEDNLVEDNHGGRLGAGIFIASAPDQESNHKDLTTQALTLGPALAVVRRNVVRKNTLRHDTPHGVGIAVSMNALIEGNRVTENEGFAPAQGAGGEAVGGGIFVQNRYVTAVVSGNWIERNRALKGGAGVFADEGAIVTVVNNVIVGNIAGFPLGAVLVDGRAGGDGPEDRGFLTVLHNTIVNNIGGGAYAQDSDAVFVNNLFWNNGQTDLALGQGGDQPQSLVAHHNRVLAAVTVSAGPGSSVTLGEGNVELDPAFVDAASGDFRLLPGSPLLGLGVAQFSPAFAYPGAWTSAPSVDFDQAPRGAVLDLGAFQRSP